MTGKMTTGDSRERLIRYLDDGLESGERRAVDEWLKSDQRARELLRDLAEQAVVVADEARVDRCRSEVAGAGVAQSRRGVTRIGKRLVALLAASVAILLLAGWWLSSRGDEEVVSVVELNGPVRWTGDGGRVVSLETEGDALEGGTVRTLSDAASVTLRFGDGSEIILAGDSEVTVSQARSQKHVYLNEGDLSARIEEQPAGRPFLIHTATAELEVLGTRFEVQSEPDATLLTVTEGAVRVTRRIDGSTVDVPADHEIKASLERREKLLPTKRKEPLRYWCSRAPVAAEPVLLPDNNEKRGGPVTLHRVQLRVRPEEGRRLELISDSVFRVRGKLEQSQSVEIMLGLTRRGGGFAGNYFYRTEPLPAGSWEIEVSAHQFGKWDYRADSILPKFPELRQIVLYTIDVDAGLVVEHVEVTAAGETPSSEK